MTYPFRTAKKQVANVLVCDLGTFMVVATGFEPVTPAV